jgi:hypothetical protein
MNDSIVEKIVALFNLADPTRNSSEGERENALRKAQELMEQYEIDMARIDAARDGKSDREWVSEPAAKKYMSKVARCDHVLAIALGKLLGLKPVSTKEIEGAAVLFCGDRASVAIAQELFIILRNTMNKMARRASPSSRRQTKFKNGFAIGVLMQVNNLKPSPAVEAKREWASAQAEARMSLVCRARKTKLSRDRAWRAGVFSGNTQDIGYERNINGVEQF